MRAINSEVMKQSNRRMVLNCIRGGPLSRSKLSERTRLTRASISQIVEMLIEEGMVAESASVPSVRPGRKQTLLRICADALWIGGVDIGRGGYHLGVMDLGGHILWSAQGEVQGRAPEDVLEECAARLRAGADSLGDPRPMYGVGLSMPGPLDRGAGVVLNPPNFRAWHGVHAAEKLRRLTGCKVYMDNVTSAHALHELYFGVGADGARDFMVMRVDEGVGAGFVMDGKLFAGVRGRVPEIGHITVERDGPLCDCGNRGCLEKYVSVPAVLAGSPFGSWAQLMDSLDTDSRAMALMERMAADLAFEIINIINVFALEKVVLSGQLAHQGARLAAEVNRRLYGKSLWNLEGDVVVPDRIGHPARIAAMPAYHSIFHN